MSDFRTEVPAKPSPAFFPTWGPVARRFLAGVGANLLGKVWVFLTQALSIPILTLHWGVDEFGVWLMLISIPTYISLSDFGFGTAAAVEVTRRLTAGDKVGALKIFQSGWAFVSSISLTLGLLITGVGALAFSTLAPCIGLVVVYALMIVQTQWPAVAFRATNKYAKGVILLDCVGLVESLLQLSAVLFGADILESLLLLVGCRSIGLAVAYSVLWQDEPWLTPGLRNVHYKAIRGLANPSIGAVALNMATSFTIQGVLLALGATTNTAVVATFATGRLLSRIPLQLSGLVTRASIPELTRAIQNGDIITARRIQVINVTSAGLVAVPIAGSLLLFGSQLAALLSAGRLPPANDILMPLVLSALVSTVWTSLAAPLMATNRHSTFSYLYLALSLATLLVPFAVPTAAAAATAWTMLAVEIVIAFVVIHFLHRFLSRPQRLHNA